MHALAAQPEGTGIRTKDSREEPDKSAFAGPIGAQQSMDLAGVAPQIGLP